MSIIAIGSSMVSIIWNNSNSRLEVEKPIVYFEATFILSIVSEVSFHPQ